MEGPVTFSVVGDTGVVTRGILPTVMERRLIHIQLPHSSGEQALPTPDVSLCMKTSPVRPAALTSALLYPVTHLIADFGASASPFSSGFCSLSGNSHFALFFPVLSFRGAGSSPVGETRDRPAEPVKGERDLTFEAYLKAHLVNTAKVHFPTSSFSVKKVVFAST